MKKLNPSVLFFGFLITGLFVWFSLAYYEIKSQQAPLDSNNKVKSLFYRTIEGLDFLFYDLRLNFRGEKKSQTPVVLLTIDDASIEQIGRWPWSREKIAALLDQLISHGAKVIGFDIVFSEPQENPLTPYVQSNSNKDENLEYLMFPDKALTQLIQNNPQKLVLGAFPEQGYAPLARPYQDYCRNEAFLDYNAEQFVKFDNVSFAVIDNAEPFEDLNLSSLFKPIFEFLKEDYIKNEYALHFSKNKDDLLPFEIKRLRSLQNAHLMKYCLRWLTDKDEFISTSRDFFMSLDHSKFTHLKNPDEKINYFKNSVLIYPIHQYDSWTINTPEMHENSLYTGSFAAYQDNDGKIRRQALFFRTGQRLGLSFVPSLALQTYLAAHPTYQAQVEIDIDKAHPEQKRITSMKIMDIENDKLVQELPVDGKGQLLLQYAGSRHMFPYLPAKELLHKREDITLYERVWSQDLKRYVDKEFTVKKSEYLKDKIFLFGATATAVYDLRVTPFDKNFPGPEIHVTALSNLLEKNYLHAPREESLIMPILLGVGGVFITFILAWFGPLGGLLLVISLFCGIFITDYQLLESGLIITSVLPVLLLISLFLVINLLKYFTEEKKKRELRSTFSKYVSPAIVDEILSAPENLELKGRKQNVTIFFSDVRGFTTISEKLDPQALSSLLNRYLTPMTEIVFKNKGTLDKYMGDAVMAFFGAPISFENHPQMACRAALESLESLKRLQKEFEAEGLPLIDIGIGINTAEVSVGNMGSEIVMSYTVMGDGVNLASRLEGINKEYGTRIVISQFTYEKVKNEFYCRELDKVQVKGKKEPVTIYELIQEKTKPLTISYDHYNKALENYYNKNFTEALIELQKHHSIWSEDPLIEVYQERIQYYIENPPPEDWKGVHEMKTK